MQNGESFGEAALLKNDSLRTCTVKAMNEVKCISIGRENLQLILGDEI